MWPFKKKAEERAIDISQPGSLEAILGIVNESGENVNAVTTHGLPAAYAAVNMIAEAVGSLPLKLYRQTESGAKPEFAHPVAKLLGRAPNEVQTASEFVEMLTRSALLRGNAYARQFHDGAGRLTKLTFLHPDSVQIKLLSNDTLAYEYTDQHGKTHALLGDEVIHIRWRSDDGIIGKSPVTDCRDSLGLGLAEIRHGARWFKNGSRPAGVLSIPGSSKDQLETIKRNLTDNHTGKNSNKLLLIPSRTDAGDFKYESLGFNNQDSQWLQSRSFTVDEVARMFNISPILLGRTEKASYANASEASRSFLTQTLNPWLNRIETTLTRSLLSSAALSLEFDTSSLLRATQKERFESYATAIQAGVMTADEARLKENLPKLGVNNADAE